MSQRWQADFNTFLSSLPHPRVETLKEMWEDDLCFIWSDKQTVLLSAVMMMERSVRSFETDRDISKYKGDISDIDGLINDEQRQVTTRRHFVSFRQRAVAILFSNMCQAVFWLCAPPLMFVQLYVPSPSSSGVFLSKLAPVTVPCSSLTPGCWDALSMSTLPWRNYNNCSPNYARSYAVWPTAQQCHVSFRRSKDGFSSPGQFCFTRPNLKASLLVGGIEVEEKTRKFVKETFRTKHELN